MRNMHTNCNSIFEISFYLIFESIASIDQTEDVDPEIVKSELRKWVLRSTIGSALYFLVLVTWIIVFQVNRESFGPKWFVMSQEEETLTGW